MERYANNDVEPCLLKLTSCGQWYSLKTLPQQPIMKKPSNPKEHTQKENSSLKTESPKDLESSSKEKVQHEDTHEDNVQPKEESAPLIDYMLANYKMHSMLLPPQVEDHQDEVFILLFETSTSASSWTNFFKSREYDPSAYRVKKKKLDDHG